jgi:thiol-disulfide isomerase/thioredoxin
MEAQMQKKILVSVITVLFVLSACSPAAPTKEAMVDKPTDAMMEKPTDAMMGTPTAEMMETPTDAMMGTPTAEMMETPTDAMMGTPTAEMMEKPTEAMGNVVMKAPAFFDVSLTNVNNGETFKISDFAGKVVLVENLAMWCPNCQKQQEQVKLLNKSLGMDSDLISIGFDVDPNENAADLKKYTESNGFDWIYAVLSQDVINEVSNLYGANFINPPSTPIIIIDRKGDVHPMPFGVKSADDLHKFIEPFLSEGM